MAGLDYEADPVEEVALGFQHAVCRTRSGKAWAWGKGERGQLGNGAEATHGSAFPVDIPGDAAVVKVRLRRKKREIARGLGINHTMSCRSKAITGRPRPPACLVENHTA